MKLEPETNEQICSFIRALTRALTRALSRALSRALWFLHGLGLPLIHSQHQCHKIFYKFTAYFRYQGLDVSREVGDKNCCGAIRVTIFLTCLSFLSFSTTLSLVAPPSSCCLSFPFVSLNISLNHLPFLSCQYHIKLQCCKDFICVEEASHNVFWVEQYPVLSFYSHL